MAVFDLSLTELAPGQSTGYAYVSRDQHRVWERFKRPYSNKIGDFTSTLRVQRSGTFQDGYWPNNGYPDIGKDAVMNMGDIVGSLGSPRNPDERYSSFHEGDALSRAIFNVQSDVSKAEFNLAVSGAEAKKTVELITHTATRIYQSARLVRKGRLFEAYSMLGLKPGKVPKRVSGRKIREHAGNYWLEMKYGWNPLLQDIHGACIHLANLLNEPDTPIFFAEGRSRVKRYKFQDISGGSGEWRWYFDLEETFEERARVGLTYRIQDGNILQAARLGLTNPFLVVWEVVPFSFVVDWFVPVGNFLSQISAYHGLDFVAGYQTQFTKVSQLYTPKPLPFRARLNGNSSRLVLRQRRVKLTGFPYATPVLKDPFSASHAVTTLALLQNVLGGFKTKGLRT